MWSVGSFLKVQQSWQTKHTHHPLDDAKGNGEALLHLIQEFDLKIKL